jgi:SAM-dependent methyltransferase
MKRLANVLLKPFGYELRRRNPLRPSPLMQIIRRPRIVTQWLSCVVSDGAQRLGIVTPQTPTRSAEVPAKALGLPNEELRLQKDDAMYLASREEFPRLLDQLELTGYGIELGVASGHFSDHLLAQGKLKILFSVDCWSDHHDDREHDAARQLLSCWGQHSVVLRLTFEEAVEMFDDETFDFIYIDGYAHSGQDDGKILADWWSKLRPGGVFAGHDYHPRWPLTMGQVDDFVACHGLKLHITQEPMGQDRRTFNSWFIVKDPKKVDNAYRVAG